MSEINDLRTRSILYEEIMTSHIEAGFTRPEALELLKLEISLYENKRGESK